jgi:hypothetical protein
MDALQEAAMTPSSFSRTGGSTRGFATTDPERQGVFAGCGRSALPKIAFTPLPSARPAATQVLGIGSRSTPYARASAAPK